jgi:hypothetical protein
MLHGRWGTLAMSEPFPAIQMHSGILMKKYGKHVKKLLIQLDGQRRKSGVSDCNSGFLKHRSEMQ